MGPIEGAFSLKLSYIEIDEHGNEELKSSAVVGIKISGILISGQTGYNYTTEKWAPSFDIGAISFDGDIEYSFGGSVYAGIGGGGHVTVKLSELGNLLTESAKKIVGCESTK